jgi:hypothetical protein
MKVGDVFLGPRSKRWEVLGLAGHGRVRLKALWGFGKEETITAKFMVPEAGWKKVEDGSGAEITLTLKGSKT